MQRRQRVEQVDGDEIDHGEHGRQPARQLLDRHEHSGRLRTEAPAGKPKTLDTEQMIADDEEWMGEGQRREKYDF